MAELVEYLSGDQLRVGRVTGREKRKLLLSDARGRTVKLDPDKVLFRHTADSAEALEVRVQSLQGDVDIPLLWELLREESEMGGQDAARLAGLYFSEESDAHASAIYRALTDERLHFRRRGKTFEPRSPDDLEKLRLQREAERRAEEEQAQLEARLRAKTIDDALGLRLERYIRQGEDRELHRVLSALFSDPAQGAYEVLREGGRLPPTVSLAILQANLRPDHPPAVLAAAAELAPPSPPADASILRAAFSIDEPSTREVDDALSITRVEEGGAVLHRVDVDIADAARLVATGDVIDREALRRAATVYLPTGTFYMLPERLGCALGSLDAGEARPAVRTSVWLDSSAQVVRHQMRRVWVRVDRRLDYAGADKLIHDDPPAEPAAHALAQELRQLHALAQLRFEHRRASGAVFFRRREWRVRVSADASEITVRRILPGSAARTLVAEFMILVNSLAAARANESGIPIIYRVQPSPSEAVPEIDPDDPAAFERLRGLIQPASLSLHPDEHWGLGLSAYTQVTSPLRRYGDLVVQRQLCAALEGRAPPYDADQLLRALAGAEATERENRRLEGAETLRWALEYLAREGRRKGLEALVTGESHGGYRVEIIHCGAQGFLADRSRHVVGERVQVDIKSLKPAQGILRLIPARGAAPSEKA